MKKNCKKGTRRNTLTKWIWFYVEEVREIESTGIDWEPHQTNDQGGDAFAFFDTTNVKFQQIMIPSPNKSREIMGNKAFFNSRQEVLHWDTK